MNYSEKYENISFTNNFAFCKVMQNEEICREVIETLLHIKVGRLEYKSPLVSRSLPKLIEPIMLPTQMYARPATHKVNTIFTNFFILYDLFD